MLENGIKVYETVVARTEYFVLVCSKHILEILGMRLGVIGSYWEKKF